MLSSILTSELITYLAVTFAFAIALSICIAAAINIDAKAYNIKHKNLWVSFGFFFSYLAVIIYLIRRKKLIEKAQSSLNTEYYTAEPVQSSSRKIKPVCIILIVLSIVLYVSETVVLNVFDLQEKAFDSISAAEINNSAFEHIADTPANTDAFEYFYDRNKKPYIDTLEVPYYTENGDEYIYDYRGGSEGLMNNSTGEFHKSEECFVDPDGYLIFDEELYSSLDAYYFYAEKDNKNYYQAAFVSWDSNGNMLDKHGNSTAIDN